MAEDAVDAAISTFALKPRTMPAVDVSGTSLPSDLDLSPSRIGTCQTLHTRVLGAHGYSADFAGQLSRHFGLDEDIASHLTENYGDRAWAVAAMQQRGTPGSPRLLASYPIIEAEIQYAIEAEMAQTAADFLARRTRLAFIDAEAAMASLPKVIDVLATHQSWTESRVELEWRESLSFLRSMGLSDELAALSREEVEMGALEMIQSRKKTQRESIAKVDGIRDRISTTTTVTGMPLPAAANAAS